MLNQPPRHEDVWVNGGILTSTLDGGEWSALRSGRFTPLDRRVSGPQTQISTQWGREKLLSLPLPGLK